MRRRGSSGLSGGSALGTVAVLAHATIVEVAAQELPLARTDQGRWVEVIATSRGKLDSLRRAMSIPAGAAPSDTQAAPSAAMPCS